jgi:hypothetical protein
MKKIIISLISVLAIVSALTLSNGCSKDETDNGTLTIKVWIGDDINIQIYPYVSDYDKLSPVTSTTVTPKSSTVSFDLNAGNYIVLGRASSFFCETGVQVKKNETVTLGLKGTQFVNH